MVKCSELKLRKCYNSYTVLLFLVFFVFLLEASVLLNSSQMQHSDVPISRHNAAISDPFQLTEGCQDMRTTELGLLSDSSLDVLQNHIFMIT